MLSGCGQHRRLVWWCALVVLLPGITSRTMGSRGAPISGPAVGCPRRFAPRRPVIANVRRRGVHPAAWGSKIRSMQITVGTVVDGKIVVEGDPLPEGTVVTILAREADETFEVPPNLEAELLESIAQADRGETISAEELLERLRRIG